MVEIMKTIVRSFGVLCVAWSAAAFAADPAVLFEERFESGNLDRWVGDVSGPHHGQIVSDPRRHDNHVLTFTQLYANGDMFSIAAIPVTNIDAKYVVSFDYLGLEREGSVHGNLGGFLGVATSINDWETGRYWIAGTDPSGFSISNAAKLMDDGAWHHYEIDITELVRHQGLTEVHLMLEDWADIGGVAGDVFFDNIRLTAAALRRHEPHLQLHVTEVTVCWESETGQNYQLQYRSRHGDSQWTNVGTPVAGNGGTNCVADHFAIGEEQRFYRVITVP